MLTVIEPFGEQVIQTFDLAPRLETLDGARLGVFSNGKPNAANLLHAVRRRLEQRYQITDVVFIDKLEVGRFPNAAPDWLLEQLTECDAILHGSGD